MALTEKSRATLFQGLSRIIDEEAVGFFAHAACLSRLNTGWKGEGARGDAFALPGVATGFRDIRGNAGPDANGERSACGWRRRVTR